MFLRVASGLAAAEALATVLHQRRVQAHAEAAGPRHRGVTATKDEARGQRHEEGNHDPVIALGEFDAGRRSARWRGGREGYGVWGGPRYPVSIYARIAV